MATSQMQQQVLCTQLRAFVRALEACAPAPPLLPRARAALKRLVLAERVPDAETVMARVVPVFVFRRGCPALLCLYKQKHSVFLVSILLPPLSLWLGGFIGATTAAAVARAPAMHVALISFGIAALLFLVTEELLLEAHEAQEHSAHEEHIWWVDMFFFLGFLLSFLMDKLLDTD